MHSQKESNKIEMLKKKKNQSEGKIVKEPKHVIHQEKKIRKKAITEWKHDNSLKNYNNKNVNAVNNNYIM